MRRGRTGRGPRSRGGWQHDPGGRDWEKKLNGAAAADELRALDKVSRPVAEYLAALDAALPVTADEPEPMDPKHISPTDPQAALTRKHGPARYA